MSLKTKLMLLSSLWLVFILVLFNVFIYVFVVNITTKSEKELLFAKAQTLSQEPEIADPSLWPASRRTLGENLVSNEMIRLVDMSGSVRQFVYSNPTLIRKPAEIRTAPHSQIVQFRNEKYLYVQWPIYREDEPVGVLEIGRGMARWSEYMDVLITALTVTSAGAVLLSVIGGFFYSRFMFRPLRQLATTMQLIQQSGTFRKLDEEFVSVDDELGRLGRTFNEMIGKLEDTFIRQKQFVADASHELRTPLTIIESYAHLLQRWGMSDPELRKEALEAIRSETGRLQSLVRSLMQLADTEQEERYRIKPFDLAALVRATARDMERSFHREIAVHANRELIRINGDPEKIKQLVILLLDNAIKYSSDPVRVRLTEREDRVLMRIRDRGIGIEPDEIPRLFDRFYRVDKARARKTGGFGLGLAIAQNIVRRHGGQINIVSRPGFGTTVTVTLPKRSPADQDDGSDDLSPQALSVPE